MSNTSIYQQYLQQNQSRFLNELLELLRIPSVSADSKFAGDVRLAAQYVSEKMNSAGAQNVTIYETGGHPIVYGEKIINSSLPTILVYGHYDVQPADPYELWDSPPFEPVIKNEKIYARGACDDKGQMYMHLKAFEMMQATNSLPCNVKFMIEGEEEVGSHNLEKFVKDNTQLLKADVVLISDTSMLANDTPSLTSGLRGLSYLEVEVTGPSRDLHSGVYGGGIANPINILCQMIASLHNENGQVTVKDFYKDVLQVPDNERNEMAKAPFDLEEYKADLQINAVHGEAGYSTRERVTIRPTLDVNGIWGGYIGEGAKTVLPSKAYAKISMRLVPNQSSETITKLFTKHFLSIAPPSVKVKVTPHHGGEAYITHTNSIAYKAAEKAMEITFNKKPLPVREGGSIPIVALFEKVLGIKSVLMGFGLNSDAIHSPNEHFGLFNYYKGIETIPHFFHEYVNLTNSN